MKTILLILACLLHILAASTARGAGALASRELQGGNFQRLNALFADLTFPVSGSFEFSEDVGIATATVTLDELVCYDVAVGNMAVVHSLDSVESIGISVDMTGLDVKCDFKFRYGLGFFEGNGSGRIIAEGSSMALLLGYNSVDYRTQPPSGSNLLGCAAAAGDIDLDFSDQLLNGVVDDLGDSIPDLIRGELEKVACDELSFLGTAFIDDFNKLVGDVYEDYSKEIDPSLEDPLYVENNKNLTDSVLPLHLLDQDSFMAYFVEEALADFESTPLENTTSEERGDEEFEIIGILRDKFLTLGGKMPVGVSNRLLYQRSQNLTTTTVILGGMRIFGLDTLTTIEPRDRLGNSTLQANLAWESLGMEFLLNFEIEGRDESGASVQDSIVENLTLAIEAESVDMLISIFVAIDEEMFGDIRLGQMMEMDNLISCFLPSLHASEVSGVVVSPNITLNSALQGFVSADIEDVIGSSAAAVFDMYRGAFSKALPRIFQNDLRKEMNKLLKDAMDDLKKSCTMVAPNSDENIDFRDLLLPADESFALGGSGNEQYGDVFPSLFNILQDQYLGMDDRTGLSDMNSILIEPLTTAQSNESGVLDFPGDLFGGGGRIKVGGFNATVEFRVRDLRIDNLDTIGDPLDLLVPVASSGQELNNTLTIGVGDRLLGAGLNVLFLIKNDEETDIKNDVDIHLDLSQATVVLGVMLKIAESRLNQFPTPELNAQGVRVKGVDPSVVLADAAASIAALNLNFTCNECSGPKMGELTELLSFSGNYDTITEGGNAVLGMLGGLFNEDLFQFYVDRTLADAARKCPHHPEYDPDFLSARYEPFSTTIPNSSTTFLVLLGSVMLGLVFAVGLLMIVIKYIVRRRHSKWLSTVSDKQVQSIMKRQDALQQQEALLDDGTHAMVSSPDIPVWVRYSIPVIILGNIAFFLSGHLSLGATVNIVLEFAGEEIVVENFYEFSMARSTIEIWNAGGRELAIVILIFSGIWPYTKQIITLVLWFLPPSRVSVSRRGSILLWLDWLAKWSMIDIFVLVVSLVAFQVSVQSPDVAFLPENLYSVKLLVVPLWGLYANMTAQLISQISSHFIIHYHRKIISCWRELHEEANDCNSTKRRELLSEHRFCRPHRGEDEKLVARKSTNSMLSLTGMSAIVLIVSGCCLPSLSINILGIVGVLVEVGQGLEATFSYSIFSVIGQLMKEASFLGNASDWIGLISLSTIVVVTVVMVPICQISALLLQWIYPTNTKQKTRVSLLIEILQAWQYTEVYLISVLLAGWQVGPISDFMLNEYCDPLNPTLVQLSLLGFIKEEDAQCFRVEASVEAGFYLLLLGAVLLTLVNTFVNKATIQYFRDKSKFIISHDVVDVEKAIENKNLQVNRDEVHRAPVLFSDTFRWALERDQRGPPGSSSEPPPSDADQIDFSFLNVLKALSDHRVLSGQPNSRTNSTPTSSEDESSTAGKSDDLGYAISQCDDYEKLDPRKRLDTI